MRRYLAVLFYVSCGCGPESHPRGAAIDPLERAQGADDNGIPAYAFVGWRDPEPPLRRTAHLIVEDVHLEAGYFTTTELGDTNGDGRAELLLAAPLKDQSWILSVGSRGSATLSEAVAHGTGAYGAGWWQAVGDQDGDGVSDLANGGPYFQQVRVVSGTSRGSLNAAPPLVTVYGRVDDAGDVTGDGAPDIAIAGAPEGVLTFLEGPVATTGEPTTFATYVPERANGSQGHPAADVNADGVPDLVVTRSLYRDETHDGTCDDEWFLGPIARGRTLVSADADFSRRTRVSSNPCSEVRHGDVDGDGATDIVASEDFWSVRVYAGPFETELGTAVATLDDDDYVRPHVLRDVDGDARDEILLTVGHEGNTFVVGRSRRAPTRTSG